MYQLLLQKQRQVTADRFERLTTSSISKRNAGKGLNATPGADRAEILEPERPVVKDFNLDPETPTEHQLVATPMKSEVRTPMKTEIVTVQT